jgi:hypothetical protein
LIGVALLPLGCGWRARTRPAGERSQAATKAAAPARLPFGAHGPIRARPDPPPLAAGQTYHYDGEVARPETIAAARAAGRLDVDLGDGWAPFVFQDSSGDGADAPKTNAYRATFVALANERVTADGQPARREEQSFLEVFGIPPTLSVLAARIEDDLRPARQACYDALDLEPLRRFTGNTGYLDRDHAKREYLEALRDAEWIKKEAASAQAPAAVIQSLRADPKRRGRVDRYLRGQARLEAVRAAQARLVCEGLLSATARTRFVDGMYDLATHEALAAWEKKNDIFGWGMLGGETLGALLRPPLPLHFDTFKRILAERVADAAGIVEDGSTAKWKQPPTYRDSDGTERPVPDLIGDHVSALLAALHVSSPEQMVSFLRSLSRSPPQPPSSPPLSQPAGPLEDPRSSPPAAGLATLHVAFTAPRLPGYYAAGADMQLAVEIDRGDVWYDFPFDARGRPIVQRRDHYPHLTLFALWSGQKIPLCWWRTTIGSWRSEVHADGKLYMKYKNSDVGPRVWKNIVAAPVWIPPDGTPVRDLLTRKVLDRNVGPVTMVNTDVMGPGFQSAYGLVMAIHVDPRRGGFDNQIRTHGSVDYTSIARRFSHGCHRLVNDRAVRLYDFVLRHHAFRRIGAVPLKMRKSFTVDDKPYSYQIKTRGYYYELEKPVPVEVGEGRIMGEVKKPITAFLRKPGVDYGSPSSGDALTSTATPLAAPPPAGDDPSGAPESTPELGP